MYRPGDYWMICDICGFKRRRSKMKQNWKKQWVCADTCWEPRHPQDFVKGRKEKIAVTHARPEPTDDYQYTASETTLGANASKGDTEITVASATGMADGYQIAVTLDNGSYIWTTINGTPDGTTVTLTDALLGNATSGDTVYFTSSLNKITTSDL